MTLDASVWRFVNRCDGSRLSGRCLEMLTLLIRVMIQAVRLNLAGMKAGNCVLCCHCSVVGLGGKADSDSSKTL